MFNTKPLRSYLTTCVAGTTLAALLFVGNVLPTAGAGILPYRVDAKKGTLFLLGFDPDKKAWGDFGGNEERDDLQDARLTAAREFNEETVFMFSLGEKEPIANIVDVYENKTPRGKNLRTTGVQVIKESLAHPETKIVFLMGCPAGRSPYHYTLYIVPVTALPQGQTRAGTIYDRRIEFGNLVGANTHGAEPTDFAWVTKQSLYAAITPQTPDNAITVQLDGKKDPVLLDSSFVNILRRAYNYTNKTTGIRAVLP